MESFIPSHRLLRSLHGAKFGAVDLMKSPEVRACEHFALLHSVSLLPSNDTEGHLKNLIPSSFYQNATSIMTHPAPGTLNRLYWPGVETSG